MTRAGSLRRLAIWGGIIAVVTLALYLPTLSGGAPWSWYIGEAPRLVWFLVGFGVGLFVGHWTFPLTKRWPELEREVAAEPVVPCDDCREWRRRLRELVRPHVLERARRGR